MLDRVFKLRTQLFHFFWRTEKTYDLAQQRKDELALCLVSRRDTCETAHLVISFWTWTPTATSTKLEDVFSPRLGLYRATVLRSRRKEAHRGACELQLIAQLYVVKGALLLLKISTPLPCRSTGCMFPWDIPVDQSYQTTCQSSRMTSPLEDVHDKMIPKSKLPSSLLQQSYGLFALVVTLTCLTHQNINHPTFSHSLYQSAFLNTFIKTGKEWEVSTKPLINLWFLMSSIT